MAPTIKNLSKIMYNSIDFKDLRSYLEEIRKITDLSNPHPVAPRNINLQEDAMTAIYDTARLILPGISENIGAFREQIFNFVFSTGEDSFKNIADNRITPETKFFACVMKYVVLNRPFKNKNFDSDLRTEVGRLGDFFKKNVAPLYKKEEQEEVFKIKGRYGFFNTLFMAIRCGNRFDSDFTETMFDTVPRFVHDSEVHFQGTNMIQQLIALSSKNHDFKLAKKYIAKSPENIYSFCNTRGVHVDPENIGKIGKNLFNDFAMVGNNGEIRFDEDRSELNFLSNVISMMYNGTASEEDRKQATELFLFTLDILNKFIEENKNREDILSNIGYHLNCKISIRTDKTMELNCCEFISPLDAIVGEIKKVRSDSGEAKILNISLELLTSKEIGLKPLETLRIEKIGTEFESRLEILDSELKSLGDRLNENKEKLNKISHIGIVRRVVNLPIEIIGKITRVKFNTPTRMRQEVTDEIREVKNEIDKNELEQETIRNSKERILKNFDETNTGKHVVEEIDRDAKNLSRTLSGTSLLTKSSPHG
ncbi:MAG: hypothetical protein LBB24_00230 [Rickettsiales bacterium]|jgi:hypothetical protein|nr:hypothetical protein [Rickettsiales bacterium]